MPRCNLKPLIVMACHKITDLGVVSLGALVCSDLVQTMCNFPVFDCLCTCHFYSFVNVSSGNLTAFTYDISWLQVKNFCTTDGEEKHVKITATIETVRSVIDWGYNTGPLNEERI